MSNKQRRKSMALIQLKIDSTGPIPKVVSDDVLVLMPGDRLLFLADSPAPPAAPAAVLVDLADSLVALVKFQGAVSFECAQLAPPDGRFVVKLNLKNGGGAGDTNPPN
jgi:hypothetical protein